MHILSSEGRETSVRAACCHTQNDRLPRCFEFRSKLQVLWAFRDFPSRQSKYKTVQNMKTKTLICLLLIAGALAASLCGCATEEQRERKLEARAKITRAQAEQIALAKVPSGAIKEGELEQEKGKLIWSFDVTTPGSTDLTEVHVDALTGQIVSLEKESPTAEAKEKSREKKND